MKKKISAKQLREFILDESAKIRSELISESAGKETIKIKISELRKIIKEEIDKLL